MAMIIASRFATVFERLKPEGAGRMPALPVVQARDTPPVFGRDHRLELV
jgi:hypothetical protein